jgi:hypothetical protein
MTRDSKPCRTGLRVSFQAAPAITALSWMVGCKPAAPEQSAASAWTFTPPIVRDTASLEMTTCHKDTGLYSAWYMVGYTGPLTDTVYYDGGYQVGRMGGEPYEERISDAPDSLIHVAIDTSQRVAVEQLVFRLSVAQKREGLPGYPVFIVNRSTDTVSIGIRPNVSLILEGQGQDGNWHALEQPYMHECGFGLRSQLLPPGAVAVTAIPICSGGVPTRLRICYGSSCSEPFVGVAHPDHL